MIEKAQWRIEGIFKANAQLVADEILNIGDDVSPEDVVSYARQHTDSELNKCFTWDDSEAAGKWRLHEARSIIGNLVIKRCEDKEPEPVSVRIFHKTPDSNYRPINFYVSNVDNYQKLLDEAMRELRAFKKKYASLSELQEILDLIN